MGDNYLAAMDFLIIPGEVLRDNRLTWIDRAILSFLVFRQGKNECSWWTQDHIASELNVTKMTVIRSLKKLESLDLVKIDHERGGRDKTNRYVISPVSSNNLLPDTSNNLLLKNINSKTTNSKGKEEVLPASNFMENQLSEEAPENTLLRFPATPPPPQGDPDLCILRDIWAARIGRDSCQIKQADADALQDSLKIYGLDWCLTALGNEKFKAITAREWFFKARKDAETRTGPKAFDLEAAQKEAERYMR